MRYIVLFTAIMVLLTSHARVRGAEFVVVNNCPKFTVVNNCPSESPAVKPRLNIDPSHTCAKCGTYANVVKEEANGMHSHQCPNCGNTWWHADPAPAASFTMPSAGCPNGNCASPKTQTRWRLFR